jgi:hypothetical protein
VSADGGYRFSGGPAGTYHLDGDQLVMPAANRAAGSYRWRLISDRVLLLVGQPAKKGGGSDLGTVLRRSVEKPTKPNPPADFSVAESR